MSFIPFNRGNKESAGSHHKTDNQGHAIRLSLMMTPVKEFATLFSNRCRLLRAVVNNGL